MRQALLPSVLRWYGFALALFHRAGTMPELQQSDLVAQRAACEQDHACDGAVCA
jgi:uncharacterized protein